MSARATAAATLRWLRDPRSYLVVGGLLMAGSAIAAAVTWPPSAAYLRPFAVGFLLVLRGVVILLVRRYRLRAAHRHRAAQLVLGRGNGSSAGTRLR